MEPLFLNDNTLNSKSILNIFKDAFGGSYKIKSFERLKKGSVKYTYYRCVGPPDWWREIRSWTVKAQVVRYFQKGLRGSAEGEAPGTYRALLEKHVTGYARDLIREASRLWDTEGVGVSVEVSLK